MRMRISHLLRRLRRQTGDSSAEPLAAIEFSIPTMVCEGCAEKLDAALHAIPGVRQIRPDVARKRVHVRYESARVDTQQLRDAIARAGFQAVDADAR